MLLRHEIDTCQIWKVQDMSVSGRLCAECRKAMDNTAKGKHVGDEKELVSKQNYWRGRECLFHTEETENKGN